MTTTWHRRVAFVASASAIAGTAWLLTMMNNTSPDELGPFGITFWFVLFFTVTSLLVGSILYWLLRFINHGTLRVYLYSFVFAAGGTLLLALNTLRSLGFLDIVLVSMATLLIAFFIRKTQHGGSVQTT